MTRVAIIGNAGGGKSTLARALSLARGLPHFPVDRLQWQPSWQLVPEAEFAVAHDAILERERWIIDGFGPWPTIEARFDRADTIILVDLPFWRHLWWATRRQVAAIVRGRADGPAGCPMLPVTFRLYRMMWQIHRELRPRLLAAIAARTAGRRVFHIRSAAELDEFRARYCGLPGQP